MPYPAYSMPFNLFRRVCVKSLFTRHLITTFGALSLVARLTGGVLYLVAAVGADAVAARSSCFRATHATRPATTTSTAATALSSFHSIQLLHVDKIVPVALSYLFHRRYFNTLGSSENAFRVFKLSLFSAGLPAPARLGNNPDPGRRWLPPRAGSRKEP